MACYWPWDGYYSKDVNASGKRSIVSNPRQALAPDEPIKMKCGRCIGCRLRYSAMWAMRCHHEAKLWPENAFLTLTFAPEHLPKFGSLSVKHCQDFMKRYRERLRYYGGRKIRMAYCGEYGEKTLRPHYHFLIFNHDFEDKYYWRRRGDYQVFRSPGLEELWPFGNSEIGSLTFESSAYVARYITKKLHGDRAAEKYWVIDRITGELLNENTKEFFKMSRRPGIGKGWFDLYHNDWYPSDEVIVDGKKFQPPKFYDSQFEILDPWTMDDVKANRIARARTRRAVENSTYERLRVREEVKLSQIKQLSRRLDYETTDV